MRTGNPVGMRNRWCGEVGTQDVGEEVRCCGWVAAVRTHGEHLRFVDLRDRTGVLQCVIDGGPELRSEYVVSVQGTVRHRPEGTVNADLRSGEIELSDCRMEVLSEAEPPPFPVSDRVDADEATRLRYRFLDLRRGRMQRNLLVRSQVMSSLRSAMAEQGFVEIETPLLWTPTPEGAREFAVPSRLHRGSFYVLPQSPQIAKQLLMVAGLDRYFQIARCLRDEDLRADRQFEFTQLDVEASFVRQQDVLSFVSEAVLRATETVTGTPPPEIEVLTWADSMDRYGTDKPDLRFGMELFSLDEALGATGLAALQSGTRKGMTVPGGGALGRGRLDALVARARELGARGLAWFRVVDSADGATFDSPLARHLSPSEIEAMLLASSAKPGDLVLAIADDHRRACEVLGALRIDLGRPPVAEGSKRFAWVVDFPLFEGVDDRGFPQAAHHPFTMPHPDDLPLLETDPLSVRSQAYDLVLNGWELGSGSIRIHRPDVQWRVFRALGLEDAEAEERFGFLLRAFSYGAPPHGGFAVGIDRLVAILAGEENIREVIAFPKTQSGSDPMTGAPKPLARATLAELGLPAPKEAKS